MELSDEREILPLRSHALVSKGRRANNCHGPRLALIRHCSKDAGGCCLYAPSGSIEDLGRVSLYPT